MKHGPRAKADKNASTAVPNTEDLPLGWECPVCGRGNSPWNAVCPCKRRREYSGLWLAKPEM